MESLRAMFPDLDQQTLQATLEAHNNSVERTVDYLLSSANTTETDQARVVQVEQDAAIARRMQAEQDVADQQFYRSAAQPATPSVPSVPSVPSMSDVQTVFKPIIDGVQYAGRVAAQSAQSLYRELVGSDQPSSSRSTQQDDRDEPVVLRGEANSPAAARATHRQRRPYPSSPYGASSTGKKDS